jgi:hypothetical protein
VLSLILVTVNRDTLRQTPNRTLKQMWLCHFA